MRVITVVSAAREAIRMSRSYGNPDLIYSFPSTAVPPPRSSKKRGSTLATREAEPPSGKSTLAVRTSLDVPLIAARVCRSCENPAHMLPACPVLYYTDTNTHHTCNWCDSVLGQAWLANGEVMWQERLILPGYENRQRFHPAGSPPFFMTANKKAKNNHGSGNQGTQNQGNQGNFNRGNQNQGAGNHGAGRGYHWKNPRGGKHNPPQGGGATHLLIQREKIKVRMVMMLTHLTCRSYLILCRSFHMPTQSQRLFTMNICMTLLLSPLTT